MFQSFRICSAACQSSPLDIINLVMTCLILLIWTTATRSNLQIRLVLRVTLLQHDNSFYYNDTVLHNLSYVATFFTDQKSQLSRIFALQLAEPIAGKVTNGLTYLNTTADQLATLTSRTRLVLTHMTNREPTTTKTGCRAKPRRGTSDVKRRIGRSRPRRTRQSWARIFDKPFRTSAPSTPTTLIHLRKRVWR